jgi:hypothetical protein
VQPNEFKLDDDEVKPHHHLRHHDELCQPASWQTAAP